MEWQPIETAPKDGTPVMIYDPEFSIKVYVAAWMYDFQWVEADGEHHLEFNPTHWMPLPEPPK
jgi:hypothetical protein